MNIALLTLSASDNCGSLLQAYALQQVLVEMGHNVVILDFISKESKKMYRIFHPSYIKSPKKLIGLFVNYNKLRKQKSDYRNFRDSYLFMSEKQYGSASELAMIDGKYELVICGSDQVWNTDMRDFNDAYLLKWCKVSSKAGYAVSLGDKKDNTLDGLKNKFIEMNDFKAFSVREKTAQDLLYKCFRWDVKLCLDPTLLLDSKVWEGMTDDCIVPVKPFLFYYSYNYEDEVKNRMVAEFAQIVKLPVWVINVSRWCDGREERYNFHICEEAGPIAFLSLMRYCEYSLVESFHGTLFSYIFRKQFFFLKNSDESDLDDRIKDIISILNLENRILFPQNLVKKSEEKMDYELEPFELKKLKDESYDFIKSLFLESNTV